MDFVDELRREHETIEAVACAFVSYAARADADRADAGRFLRFFRAYAGRFHHGREEEVLFDALVRETGVPTDRGPLHALLSDHHHMAKLLDELEVRLARDAIHRYVSALLHHLDAENSVLFPECEARFRRTSVLHLDARRPDDDERAALDDAPRLVERYGRTEPPGLFRGEGCVCCPAFGERCDGVEREWSSDLEWEDMLDRVGR